MPPFRPPIPPNDKTNDPQLIQLMRDCWDEYSTLRPDFSTIRSRFLVINKGKYDNVLILLKLMNDRYFKVIFISAKEAFVCMSVCLSVRLLVCLSVC